MPMSEDDKAELVAYLDGELDEAAAQAVEARVAADPEIRAELEALKQTWGMLEYLPKASPSPSFTHQTMQRLTLERVATRTAPMPSSGAASSMAGNLLGLAAIVLALVGGYLATTRIQAGRGRVDPIPEDDLPLVRHLRIAEKWRFYENVDDLEFIQKLNHPDLFGEDPG